MKSIVVERSFFSFPANFLALPRPLLFWAKKLFHFFLGPLPNTAPSLHNNLDFQALF